VLARAALRRQVRAPIQRRRTEIRQHFERARKVILGGGHVEPARERRVVRGVDADLPSVAAAAEPIERAADRAAGIDDRAVHDVRRRRFGDATRVAELAADADEPSAAVAGCIEARGARELYVAALHLDAAAM